MDFDFGTISAGTDVSFKALEFSDLFLGMDTALAGSSFSLTSVTLDGSASTFAATGLSYSAGAGEAGNLVIATDGAVAYNGLMGGATREVVVSYSINNGMGTENGTITFDVEGTATLQSVDVAIDLQDDPVTAGDLTAMAIAAPGESAHNKLNIATDDTLADMLLWLDLDGAIDISKLPSRKSIITSTIALASANDDATATATANLGYATAIATTDGSQATATARMNSTANALSKDNSTVTASANNESSATATADVGSTATSVANDQSQALANTNSGSEAQATADSISVASASATAMSSATATADNASIASAAADDNSTSVATSDDGSAADAFSGDSSVANASGLNTAVANAFALDASSASANASNTSDARSVAINRGAAEAIADTTGSASAASQNESTTAATATNSSTANALAVDLAQAVATSTQDSVALAAAIECGNAGANARNTGAAWAVGSLTGTPVATADGNPVADEASGPVTVTPALSFMDIEGDVTVSKAQIADFAQFAFTSYNSSGSANLAPTIQALVTLDPPVPAPACGAKPPQAVPGPTGFMLLILIAALTFVAARASKPTVIESRTQSN